MTTNTQQYVLTPSSYTLHDRPLSPRLPIRRIQTEGADVLKVNELLQVALGRVEGFEPLLNEYGVELLSRMRTVSEVSDLFGVDTLQASRILAMLALGKRIFAESNQPLPHIRGVEDVYKQYSALGSLTKEQMRVLVINSRYQVIHEETISIGSIDTLHVTPVEVLQPAIARLQHGIVLVHNHPSGDCSPSQSDIDFTNRILEAGKLLGVELLDHVIIGKDCYQSCLVRTVDK